LVDAFGGFSLLNSMEKNASLSYMITDKVCNGILAQVSVGEPF
jgi:hypothetical protein